VARELDAQWRERGHTTGLITRDAAFVADQALAPETPPLHQALAMMQRDPRVQALVVATTPERAIARGLALESADAVALLAREPLANAADEAQAVTLALRAARGAIVVESDNGSALALLHKMILTGTLERARLILVGTRLHDPAVDAHVAAGGTAVLRVADPDGERFVVRRRDATVTVGRSAAGRAASRPDRGAIQARLVAIALAWALDRSTPGLEPAAPQRSVRGG
jgi:hypothetical protein